MLQARTDIGLVRATNQDVALAEMLPDGRSLLVVADGVGGLPGGEVASRTAVGALVEALREGGDEPPAGYPRVEPPAGYPRVEPPAGYPRVEPPAGYPRAEPPAGYPRAEPPAGYPRVEPPAGYPRAEPPAGYPRVEPPAGYPRAEPPAGYPRAEPPAGYPRAEPPAGYPRVEATEAALRRAFASANDAVRAGQQGELARMSTTLVAALVRESTAWVANIGDSRAYLVADGEARQLTLDHSWVEESIRAGQLSPDDPLAALNRHLITRAIGLEAGAAIDVFGPIEVPAGGVLLLCTDGLHGVLDDHAIADAVAASEGDYARDLVDLVIALGAPDNVGVALHAEPALPGGAATMGGIRT